VTAPVFIVPPATLDALATATSTNPGRAVLDGAEGRHAVSVRRLRVGEALVLTDGQGRGAAGVVAAVDGRDRLEVEVAEVRAEPAPTPHLTVVQALPKGDRGELAVETMTETGVDAIVPWAAARCVTQWKAERGQKALARWRSTAREAAKQSRRLRFPEVTDLMTTRQLGELLAGADLAAVLHEEGSLPLATAELPTAGRIVLVVGPEGGVSPEESAAFAAAGAEPYRLGPSVLRTSTAGTAAAAVLLARTGRWG
jgi:16S rRNA (uracil1498-N3)-methyltransferase